MTHYTIPEFLAHAPFGRRTLYYLWQAGDGPDHTRRRVGRSFKTLIPANAGLVWLAGYRAQRRMQP